MASSLLSLPHDIQQRIFSFVYVPTALAVKFAADYATFPQFPVGQISVHGCHPTSLLQTCSQIYILAKAIRDASFTGVVVAKIPREIAVAKPWIRDNLTSIHLRCPWMTDLSNLGRHSRLNIPLFPKLETISITNLEHKPFRVCFGPMAYFVSHFLLDPTYALADLVNDAKFAHDAMFVSVLAENLPLGDAFALYNRIGVFVCTRYIARDLETNTEVILGVTVLLRGHTAVVTTKAVLDGDQFKCWQTDHGGVGPGVALETTSAERPGHLSWVARPGQ